MQNLSPKHGITGSAYVFLLAEFRQKSKKKEKKGKKVFLKVFNH
jgi:hypothetical protein